MAKNKQKKPKGKKQRSVFQVAEQQKKPKGKSKAVRSSLKQIKALKNEKVENLNQIFSEVQRDMRSLSKSTAKERKAAPAVMKKKPQEAVNVDGAAQLLSQL